MENNFSISERWLLRGAPNARDLGGLPTTDGRTVRPGLLLRSGELAGITEPDAQTLSQYPLRTVVDFRTDLEREQKPDRVLPDVQYVCRTRVPIQYARTYACFHIRTLTTATPTTP